MKGFEKGIMKTNKSETFLSWIIATQQKFECNQQNIISL